MKEILIVDDEPLNIKVLSLFLAQENYHWQSAENGEIALQLLIQQPKQYSLVLADRIMPRMNALQLINAMKDHELLADIPVVVQTGIADKEEMVEVIKAGAFDFLIKPIDKDLLLAVVKRALQHNSKHNN